MVCTAPAGPETGWMAQVLPSQCSASARGLPWAVEKPTAVQSPRTGQDTPPSRVEPGGLGTAWTRQAVPAPVAEATTFVIEPCTGPPGWPAGPPDPAEAADEPAPLPTSAAAASAAARLRFLTAISPSGRIRWRDLSSVPTGTRSRQLRGSFAAVPQLPARGPPRPPSLGPGCYRPWEPAAMSRAGDDLRGGEGEAGGQADPIPAGDQAGAAVHGEDVQVPPAGLHPVGAVAVGEFHPPVQGPGPGAVDNEASPRTCRADLQVADRPAHHGGAAVIGDEVDVPGQAEQGDVPGQRARARASVDHTPGDAPGAGAGQPAARLELAGQVSALAGDLVGCRGVLDRRRDQPERHGPARLDGPGGGRGSRPGGQAGSQAGSHAGERDPG